MTDGWGQRTGGARHEIVGANRLESLWTLGSSAVLTAFAGNVDPADVHRLTELTERVEDICPEARASATASSDFPVKHPFWPERRNVSELGPLRELGGRRSEDRN